MLKKAVFVFSLVLVISSFAQSQVQLKEPVQIQPQMLTASAIDLEEGEKLLVVPAAGFQFESPAAVTGDFIYYVKSVLEIHSNKVPLMSFVAPVSLPQGSEIKRIGMCFSDSSTGSVVRLKLWHNNPIHPEQTRGVLASVKSYQTKDSKTYAVAKSGPTQDVTLDIQKGYFYLTLNLQRNYRSCRFAYAYVIYR